MSTAVMEEPEVDEVAKMDEAQREHYDQIRDKGEMVAAALSDFEISNNEAKELKKRYERLSGEMLAMIRRGPDMQKQIPFPSPDDAWRAESIDELELPEALAMKLCEHDLETLGELFDFWANGGELTSYKGIGAEKAAQVADAMAAFWEKHPEYCEGKTGDETDEPVDDQQALKDEIASELDKAGILAK